MGHLSVPARPQHRARDVLVAGEPADLPGDSLTDLGGGWLWVAVEQPPGRHHHAWGAEAALQAMTFGEALLDRIELGPRRETFYRPDAPASDHHRQQRAGLHRSLVEPYPARDAAGGVTAPVGYLRY